jgi:hypothetical protein
MCHCVDQNSSASKKSKSVNYWESFTLQSKLMAQGNRTYIAMLHLCANAGAYQFEEVLAPIGARIRRWFSR